MLLAAQEFSTSFSDPPSPNEPTFITRPKLANLFSEEDSGSGYLKSQELLKHDEVLSRELEGVPSHIQAASAPESQDLFVASPLSYSFSSGSVPTVDLSQSPAALFLSSFSPSAPVAVNSEDAEGAVIAGYTLGPIVGVGGFSTIRQAISSDGGSVAVKIVRRFDLSARARKRLDRETAIWRSLSHEHVLPLFSVTQTAHADYYVTLYCPAGTLFDILKRDGHPALLQDDAGMMFRQVVRGLRYLHEVAGVVHGDMKLENVLVDEMGVCRIADFGMARKIGEVEETDIESSESSRSTPATLPRRSHGTQGPLQKHLSMMRHSGPRHRGSTPLPSSTTTPCRSREFPQGSLPYASPELLLSPSATPHSPNPAQDIWALGVMLYTLLTGRLPFMDSYDPRLQMKILHGVYEMPKGIGHGAERVLTGCLERSVPNRWTIAMVDEVAWGIGWGADGDEASPPPELPSRVASKSRSRSRPGVRIDADVVDDLESVRSPSCMTRSDSRSPSSARRASRSTSRHAHAHTHHPYELHHQLHHHHDHSPHPRPIEPSFSALTNAILRTSSADSDSSGSAFNESALLMTPGHPQRPARERGRLSRPKAQIPSDLPIPDSRSISPFEALLTPADSIRAAEPPESVDKSSVMGDVFSPMVESTSNDIDEHWSYGNNTGVHSATDQLRHVLEKDLHRFGPGRRGSVPPLSARTPFQCPSPSGLYTPATPRSIQSHGTRSRSADLRPAGHSDGA